MFLYCKVFAPCHFPFCVFWTLNCFTGKLTDALRNKPNVIRTLGEKVEAFCSNLTYCCHFSTKCKFSLWFCFRKLNIQSLI